MQPRNFRVRACLIKFDWVNENDLQRRMPGMQCKRVKILGCHSRTGGRQGPSSRYRVSSRRFAIRIDTNKGMGRTFISGQDMK